MSTAVRSPAQITYSAWKALFLRNAVARVSASRFAWFWLLAEPIAFIAILMLLFMFLRVRHIGGINTGVWIMSGVLSFLMFRRTASEAMTALRVGRPLYTFSQIRPFDPVVVNAALEGFIMVLVSIVLLAGAFYFGLQVIPADPLRLMEALLGLWLLGLGYGLINSVALAILPPLGSVMRFMLTRPLYFLSGVMFPVALLPYPYRDWFLLNPIVHGVEAARFGFAPYYRIPPEISVAYLYGWALVLIFLGMALHVRYARRLAVAK
jgi:capsular polysaccharide transport system permease protein